MDVENIWKLCLQKIKEQLAPMSFDTWFKDTVLLEIKNNKAVVLVPMHIHKKHIKESYNDLVEEVFTDVTGSNFQIEYITEEEQEKNIEVNTDEMGVPNNINFETNLNPQYTFDTFIVGNSNKFAQATALAVAEKPGYVYNPLFIYGNSGLGKTHLMHAIGNYIVKNTNKRVLYITCEKFVEDFLDLYRKNKDDNNFSAIENFKRKYRDLDVLMIDDIQYLEIASKTQQEFFNTFNELHQKNKQIIICSDKSPDDLKKFEDRLKTRFFWGITVDLLPPDLPLRLNIIDKKIEGQGITTYFPDDVKNYIASNCTSDIRKLEGAITRVFAYATIMNGSDITLELAVEALKDYFGKTFISKNKINQVQQIIANTYNISVEDLKSKKRMMSISVPRQIGMYICRTFLKESLPKIGLEFGGKDHTTVMHSVDKIKKAITKDSNLEQEINKIVEQIK